MNVYNKNIDYLCDQRNMSLSEFEQIIYIPKVRIMEPTPDELVKIADYFNLSIDILIKKDLKHYDTSKHIKIKLVLIDVDGTMTDGGMYFTENGDQIKKYNTKDGMAIGRRAKEGLQFGIISHGHKLNMVQDRADLLGIQHVYVGQKPKTDVLHDWCQALKIVPTEVAFIGDDINDIEIMKTVGLSACPADAVNDVKKVANIILKANGGKGCVREFIDEWI
ncbi:HAD family hydrolase [Crocinitomix algicola]|uniref:HAD family hydrolase n=1 Tax=Crocinitomix algicola TaxID=1740263 RepID=UPI001C2F5C1B|nr:HAD family hydrolase [Crocinitomix algicola]